MSKAELNEKFAEFKRAEKKRDAALDDLISTIERYHGLVRGETKLFVEGGMRVSSAPGVYIYEGIVVRFFMFNANLPPSVMGRKVLKSGALHKNATRLFRGDWVVQKATVNQ